CLQKFTPLDGHGCRLCTERFLQAAFYTHCFPRGSRLPQYLEKQFQSQLDNSWVRPLSSPERAERRVAIDFIERINRIGAIHRSCAIANRSEVRVVEDIEEIRAELQLPAFRKGNVLRKLHIPILRTRQAKSVFAYIP